MKQTTEKHYEGRVYNSKIHLEAMGWEGVD
jgi:hypothetical protein